jgi:tRNA(Arg) A34 adenosine deaminase TadA
MRPILTSEAADDREFSTALRHLHETPACNHRAMDDNALLLRAIELAAAARAGGEAPFGSLLADADGVILAEDHNTVGSENDITAHPELKLARWAAANLDAKAAASTTMFTSTQPCGMCSGAIDQSGLGRVVYALSGEQIREFRPAVQRSAISYEGPVLAVYDAARAAVEG